MKKPRSDAKLKNLPPERQKEIYEFMQGHSLQEAKEWLAPQGLRPGNWALSQFWHWYPLSRQVNDAIITTETLREILRELPDLEVESARLSEASQAIFEARALQKGDAPLFVALRRLRQQDASVAQGQRRLEQKDEALHLARHRYQRDCCQLFAQWYEKEEARAAMSIEVSYADRIEALGRVMFGDDWDEDKRSAPGLPALPAEAGEPASGGNEATPLTLLDS